MIYRFRGSCQSFGAFEIQLHAPPGQLIKHTKRALREAFAAKGIAVGPMIYIGSIELDGDHSLVPENDLDPDRNYIQVVTKEPTHGHAEENYLGKFCGWYTPGDNEPGQHKCVIDSCESAAVFHLCQEHAVPGMVFQGRTGSSEHGYVISCWLVERDQELHTFALNDFALGTTFGGRAGIEKLLAGIGYKIVRVMASLAELEEVKVRHPEFQCGSGPESLPGFVGYEVA